jgi:hypothetical protein
LFKKIKNGIKDKGYILTINYDIYKGYKLADDLFQFINYLKSLEKFYKAFYQAK